MTKTRTGEDVDAREQAVVVRAGKRTLGGMLVVPDGARALIVFPRAASARAPTAFEQVITHGLHHARLATLAFDLLTLEEEAENAVTGDLGRDVDLFAARLGGAIEWVTHMPEMRRMKVGCIAAGAVAAAALVTAAKHPERIFAIVAHAGRCDLAGSSIERVTSPTLLIVDGTDAAAIEAARRIGDRLPGPTALALVPGAGRPSNDGALLDQVAQAAREWFIDRVSERVARPRDREHV